MLPMHQCTIILLYAKNSYIYINIIYVLLSDIISLIVGIIAISMDNDIIWYLSLIFDYLLQYWMCNSKCNQTDDTERQLNLANRILQQLKLQLLDAWFVSDSAIVRFCYWSIWTVELFDMWTVWYVHFNFNWLITILNIILKH